MTTLLRPTFWQSLLMLGMTVLSACGSSAQKKIAWEEVMRRWFASAAAQPTDPPFSTWTPKEEELFLRRIGYADVALVGRVTTVGTYSHRDSPKQVTFAMRPLRILHGRLDGEVDENGELVLMLDNSDLDFRRAVFVQRFLPGQLFLAFLKEMPAPPAKQPTGWQASLWRPPPAPKRVFKWALYRPEPELLRYVKRLYDLLSKKK